LVVGWFGIAGPGVCDGLIAAPPTAASKTGETRSAAEAVDFRRDVFPIFRRDCLECHGEKEQEAGLRLDSEADFVDAGVIEVDEPDQSELLRRVTLPRGHDEVMPMVGEPLVERDVDTIRRWIAQGAPWPDDFTPPPHWAYVAPVRPELPAVDDPNWERTPIDRFVSAGLDDRDRAPSPRAPAATLLRRVHLDLIGLPPSPAEVADFVADPSPAAYRQVVDDLLSRPQFGERWARHWLDLARYADSHGFQRDNLHELWAYRDWVIRAMNDDMPFDQFTIEQLAGDLLPDPTESQRIATGFHRCSPTNVEAGSLPEETRIEQVIDRVNTTATVWLGSTLECAQCHDHKFDPFTSKDYYRLLAFFNNTQREADRTDPRKASSIAFQGPSMPLADPELDVARAELRSQVERLEAQRQTVRRRVARELPKLTAELADRTRGSVSPAPEIIVKSFRSEGTTDTYEHREDGSILITGDDPPSTDVYTITAVLRGTGIRSIRLDTLTDDALPGTGPGRGDPVRSNFVLNDLAATLGAGDDARRLKFTAAVADYSQNNYPVTAAIDDSVKTGWAIGQQFGKSHWAAFELSEPIDAPEGVSVTFVLTQQFGQARTIGCLRLTASSSDTDAEAVPQKIRSLVKRDPKSWSGQERRAVVDHFADRDPESVRLATQIDKVRRELNGLEPPTTLVMVELDQPRPSAVFMRGDYRSPGEPVSPGPPEWLHPLSDDEGSPTGRPDRLTLARWLVDPANPLAARVTVNRWWAELFGEGLVRTPEDFGVKGERPTHPRLLDWLAVELVENGWSMKHVIKTIVLSATYQQSSVITPELAELDDQNRWLARGPRYRLSAEMIRDNALAISGLISLKPFGPPIRPYQPAGIWSKVGGTNYEYETSPGGDAYRRGVYVVIKRGSPYPSFINFDANNRFACTVSRSRSNTPLQALTLLNDRVYVEAARAIAWRAMRSATGRSATGRSIASTIREEFVRCVARNPTDAELETLTSLYSSQRQAAEQDPQSVGELLPDDEAAFLADDDRSAESASLTEAERASEFSAWYSVATVLLNLHETITKE